MKGLSGLCLHIGLDCLVAWQKVEEEEEERLGQDKTCFRLFQVSRRGEEVSAPQTCAESHSMCLDA